MKTPRKRHVRPSCEGLETRRLLDGSPTAQWIGQDGHDLAGRSASPGPNGVQDVHVAIAGLSSDREISGAEVRGYGGGIWTYDRPGGHWAVALERDPGASGADVYFEPNRVEVGRSFSIRLWYIDGTTTFSNFDGGVADPTLRTSSSAVRPTWIGQDGTDRVALGPSVGPDGRLDAVIALANLAADAAIQDVEIDASGGLGWASGTNADGKDNAEFLRDPSDPTRGRLAFGVDSDLDGLPLRLTIHYANATLEQVTLVADATDPTLRVPPASVPTPLPSAIATQWLGQADDATAGPGAARVALSGLPSGRTVVGAVLSGPDRGVSWAYTTSPTASVNVEPKVRPLAFRLDGSDASKAAIAFAPEGSEQGATMTLRLNFDDGSYTLVSFASGSVDPTLRAPKPSLSSVVARPGDDLQALAGAFGSVHLSAGTYELTSPLILDQAVSITAEPGATLRFRQPDDAAAWPSAITVHAGNTTLSGFGVRFDGPVRWDWSLPYEPAVIATTDQRDKVTGTTKVGLTFTGLDLEGPPASSTNGPLERSAKLLNLVTAEDGLISGNTLRGGGVFFVGGPWEFSGNTYLGALPGTQVLDVVSMTSVHDVRVVDNVASPLPGSGKTYRFLVMTQDGSDILVSRNRVEGIGARDDDAQPHPNTPEVILTEAYRIRFEGPVLAQSSDGRIARIAPTQGEPIRAGDVLAVLSGPSRGQWRRVAQVIDPLTLLLDSPLPTDGSLGAVSVSTGFTGLTIEGNRVDVRGSSESSPLVLAGVQFGTVVYDNTWLGGAAVRLWSTASEQPLHWGWTQTPNFGVRFTGNTIIDSLGGVDAGVNRYPQTKSSAGRTYFDGSISDNIFAWSPAFFDAHGGASPPAALVLGDARSPDPLESRLAVSGNAVKVPDGRPLGPGLLGSNLVLNGSSVSSMSRGLPPEALEAPSGLRLVRDTGRSASDGLTGDARLDFDRSSWAVSTEYRLDGESSYHRIETSGPFLPAGLVDGPETVHVRSVDDYGRSGPEASLTFRLDTEAPEAVAPRLGPGQDTGASSTDNLTRIKTPAFEVDGDPTETFVLIRRSDGAEVARRDGPGLLKVPSALADGSHAFAVRRIDAAGNASTGEPLTIRVDATPPRAAGVALAPGQDTGVSSADRLTRINAPAFQVAGVAADDTVLLLRGGSEVSRRVGPGTLKIAGPLPDGTYRFEPRVLDPAGNAADGAGVTVTIDATPPPAVSDLKSLGGGRFTFTPVAGAAESFYRVGGGPTVPLAGASSFKVRGLPFEPTPVAVRVIDPAGNLGPEAVVTSSTTAPVGRWIGQRSGVDFVGPQTASAAPDGVQDVAIAIEGLPTDRAIVSAEVRGWGGGIWQYEVAGGTYWKAALSYTPGSDRAELYVQPYMVEAGRPYFVRLWFDDGTTVGVTLGGGPVDPKRSAGTADESGGIGGGVTLAIDPGAGPVGPYAPVADTPNVAGDRPDGSLAEVAGGWRERIALIRAAQRERLIARQEAFRAARLARLAAQRDRLDAARRASARG